MIVIRGQARFASVTFPFPDERGVPKLAACDRIRTCPDSYLNIFVKLYSIGRHTYSVERGLPWKSSEARGQPGRHFSRLPHYILKWKSLSYLIAVASPRLGTPVFHIYSYFDGGGVAPSSVLSHFY